MSQTLTQELKKLRSLKQKYDKASKAKDDAERAYRLHEARVFERMEHEDVQSQKQGDVQFVRSETVYAQVQDRGEFVKWALENDEGLVEEKERKAVLSQLVRERLDNGEALPPGVGFYTKQYISQRAA